MTTATPQVQTFQPGPISGSTLLNDLGINLQNISASIGQIISGLGTLAAAIPADQSAAITKIQSDITAAQGNITTLQTAVTAIQAIINQVCVVLTNSSPAGTTWNIADQVGYPNIALIVVYPGGFTGNVLNLPALGVNDQFEIKIKSVGAGSVSITSASANIKEFDVGAAAYVLSYNQVAAGLTHTVYGTTLRWVGGTELSWHIVNTAINVSN